MTLAIGGPPPTDSIFIPGDLRVGEGATVQDIAGALHGVAAPPESIGAVFESSSGKTNNGVVRVYSGATDTVIYSFEGDADDDRFGYDVASAGDVNNDGWDDVVVGAPLNDAGGASAGGASLAAPHAPA